MQKIKNTARGAVLSLCLCALGVACSPDRLDLNPIDNHSAFTFWKKPEEARGYVVTLQSYLRGSYDNLFYYFGEARSGVYRDGVSADGSSLNDDWLRLSLLSQEKTIGNFGSLYGGIVTCNQYIQKLNELDLVTGAEKEYYLGIAHGMRAYYNFVLYRNYGEVPLRVDAQVYDGVFDPVKQYLGRAKGSEVFAHIKEDITKSLEYFGTQSGFNNYGHTKDTWSKATSEALAAEFYLWSAKVDMDDKPADESLLAQAKTHLKNLESNYGLALQPTFESIFSQKENAEIITAIKFREGENTNNFSMWTYQISGGQVNTGATFRADGTPWRDYLQIKRGGSQRREYHKNLYDIFDEADTRRDETFKVSYSKENGNLVFKGLHVSKNLGHINAQGNRVYDGDIALYRLPWVYLSLAEVANMEGNGSEVKKYIDLVRARAYGSAWDPATYGFTPGDFKTNELAILKEKDKEFVREGQRWYDVRRMTESKGGRHLVFIPEVNYTNPTKPILDEATESHKVFYPIEKNLLDRDPLLKQTAGY